MRRWTWVALAIVVAFTGATLVDDCSLAGGKDCSAACHFACPDGCGVAPLEPSIVAPPATEACQESRVELTSSPLDLDSPPELIPPRA